MANLIGRTAIFTYPSEFSDFKGHRDHSGQMVTIISEGDDFESHSMDGDPLWNIRAMDGWEGCAWGSELELQPDKPQTAEEFVNAMREQKTNDMFYTPQSKEELDAWLDVQKLNAFQMTALMVGMNYAIQQMRNSLPPQEFVYWFETDEGITEGSIFAQSIDEATEKLKAEFPDDHNADGEFTDEDGKTHGIDW